MNVPMDEPLIWSVFDSEERLVLAISNVPGEFNFARLPDVGADPLFCDFATLQCYTSEVESEALGILTKSRSVKQLLDYLHDAGFRVVEGRPQVAKIARL